MQQVRTYGYLQKRVPETVASGSFLIVDHCEGIEEEFRVNGYGYSPDDCEIDTYKGESELREKVKWWLAHDKERAAASRRGQRGVLERMGNVTFAHRLVEFTSGK